MKKSTMKKVALTSLVAAFSVVLGASVSSLNASADTEYTAKTVEQATSVAMAKGASARINEDGKNGLRYTLEVSTADYKGLRMQYGKDIQFGILIAPDSYNTANALNAENVFGENAVYDWATMNDEGNWVYEGTKTRIINLSATALAADEANPDKYVLYGTIANLNESNYAVEFRGVGYVAYKEGETTKYKFLENNDNVRSMAYVAQVYQTLDSVSAEDKATVLSTYITGKADQVDTTYTVNHMLSDGNGGYTVGEAEKVTAKINAKTAEPESKTFAGYCFDATNAKNSTGDTLVYANGKTEALNLYYTNDYNYNMVKNADGSYSATTAGRGWSSGPLYPYTFTTKTAATTAVYSVKMEATSALACPVWGQGGVGIMITADDRLAEADWNINEWADQNTKRALPVNSLYTTLFAATPHASKDVQIFSARGMGYANMGNGSLAKFSAEKTSVTMTVVLYSDMFYIYLDDVLVGSQAVTSASLKNFHPTTSGTTYGYNAGDAFKFGVGAYCCETPVKYTILTEKYGEEALAEINSNNDYKYTIVTPLTVNATKNADGSYTQTKAWFNYSYAYTSTNFSDTVVYKTQITTTGTDLSSCNAGGDWIARVGIAFSNGETIGASTYKDRLGTARACQESWLSNGFVAIGAYPITANDPRKWVSVGAGPDGPCAYLHSKTQTVFNQHTRYCAIGSPVLKDFTLTAVLYKGTIYVYVNDAYKTSISLDNDLLDWTNVNGVKKEFKSTDKLIFGTTALLMEHAPVTKELQYLTDAEALAEITAKYSAQITVA